MNSKLKYYFIACFEGAAVMVAELCANKLITPFFGTSIQVWAATLGITLIGLAAGYFLGSRLSSNVDSSTKYLRICLIAATFFLILSSFISNSVAGFFLNLPLELGATLSLFIILFPILLALGSCSSLLITLLNNNSNQTAGNSSGKIYGISTIGGVLATFLAGFVMIPHLGIRASLLIMAFLLLIVTVFSTEMNFKIGGASILILGAFSSLSFINTPTYNSNFNVLYEGDGVMGNIKVIEHTSEDFTSEPVLGRGLVVNNTLQTYMDVEGPGISVWEWAHIIPTIAGVKPANSKTLLLGLGGGTVFKQLKILDHQIDVVEIDQQVVDVCSEFFGVQPDHNFHVTDARYFLKKTDKKYDVIIYDLFLSESPPEHLLTKEGLADAMDNVEKDGFLIINFFGFLTGDKGYAARSLAKTIKDQNYLLQLIPTPGLEEYRNLLFIVAKEKLPDYMTSTYSEPGKTPVKNWSKGVIPVNNINLFDAEVLTDAKPKLSKLYKDAAVSWKKGYNEIYTKKLYAN